MSGGADEAGGLNGAHSGEPDTASTAATRGELVAGVVDVLSPRVRRILAPNPGVMTGSGTNTYLVGTDEIAVIDPGPDDEGHIEAIVAAGAGRIRWILLTHTHWDHWPATATLAARTGAEVLAFEARDGLEIDGTIGDGDVIASGFVVASLTPGDESLAPTDDDRFTLRAIHTPGHASNHLCFLLEEERLLFTGDQVMHGSTVVLYPPEGDVGVYLASLRRLLDLDPPLRAMAPAHGLMFGDPAPVLHGIIDHRLAREQKVLTALIAAAAPVTVDELLPAVYDDIDLRLSPIARGSLWAHLRKLVDDGRATTTDAGDLDDARWAADLSGAR